MITMKQEQFLAITEIWLNMALQLQAIVKQAYHMYINLQRTAFKCRFRAQGMEFSPRRPFKSFRVFDNKRL